MLSPRAIATLGIGFGALSVAHIGLWPVDVTPVKQEQWLGGGKESKHRYDYLDSSLRKAKIEARLNPKVKQIIAKVAKRAATIKTNDDRAIYLDALIASLERSNQAYRDYYADILNQQIAQQQLAIQAAEMRWQIELEMREEEEILFLAFLA